MTGAVRRVRRLVFGGLLLAAPFVSSVRPCAQWVCQTPTAPSPLNGSITLADPFQTGQLVRTGVPSICTPRGGVVADSALYHYDFWTINSVHSCITVNVNASGCGANQIFVAAYTGFTPTNPALNLIGDLGSIPSPNGSFTFPILSSQTVQLIVSELTPNAGCANYSLSLTYRGCRQPGFDRSTDRRGDVTVFRPSDGVWHTIDSVGGPIVSRQFGVGSDVITPGTYTNDVNSSATNLSVWRPGAQGVWYYLAPNSALIVQPWGTMGDIPVPSDFDADGRIDYTVFRPSTGVWWSRLSTTAAVLGRQFGQNGDIPFAGDVDGDLITDYGIVRPVGGALEWWIYRSYTQDVLAMTFGFSTDKPVAADYDGDRRTDIAVWRPSNGFWYYLRSSDGGFTGFPFGGGSDIPQPSDRDGDGKADFVVFRQSPTPGQTVWYSWLSATGTLKSEPWGLMGDVPALAQNRIQ
jgi:hypothetical protein